MTLRTWKCQKTWKWAQKVREFKENSASQRKVGVVKPQPNGQTLFGKHFKIHWSRASMHACTLGHHDRHCLTRTFCLAVFLKLFKNTFACDKEKMFTKHPCIVAKPTNNVLDTQNFNCLPNNVCPFGQGSTIR